MIKNLFCMGGLFFVLHNASFGTEKPNQELALSLPNSSPSITAYEKVPSSYKIDVAPSYETGIAIELYNNHPKKSYTLNLEDQMESWQGNCSNATAYHSHIKVMIFCGHAQTKESFFFPIQGKLKKICLAPQQSILLNIDFQPYRQRSVQENFQQFIRIWLDSASYITVFNPYSLDGAAFYKNFTPINFSHKTNFIMPICKGALLTANNTLQG